MDHSHHLLGSDFRLPSSICDYHDSPESDSPRDLQANQVLAYHYLQHLDLFPWAAHVPLCGPEVYQIHFQEDLNLLSDSFLLDRARVSGLSWICHVRFFPDG